MEVFHDFQGLPELFAQTDMHGDKRMKTILEESSHPTASTNIINNNNNNNNTNVAGNSNSNHFVGGGGGGASVDAGDGSGGGANGKEKLRLGKHLLNEAIKLHENQNL